MATDMLTIATSGAKAARAALDITAQNIANAASEGYSRRSLDVREVAAPGSAYQRLDLSFAGVRMEGIARSGDAFRAAELRRSTSGAEAASAELAGLIAVEDTLKQSKLFDGIVGFEASLQALEADPVDPSLRAAVIGVAEIMARSFNLAASELEAAGGVLHGEAKAAVDKVNGLSGELARLNKQMVHAPDGGSERASLLDRRDNFLLKLAEQVGISATFAQNGTIAVRMGGVGGPLLVDQATATALSTTSASGGTLEFAIGDDPVIPAGGALAGKAAVLAAFAKRRSELDDLALNVTNSVNNAQTDGVALDGSTGQPLFTGSDAATLKLAFANGTLLATAPAGSAPGSRDPSNLLALRTAFKTQGYANAANSLLFAASSAVASRRITGETLSAIADADRTALDRQAGVNLDREAADLVRFQQAFEASGRAMQAATEIFDTLLGIGR